MKLLLITCGCAVLIGTAACAVGMSAYESSRECAALGMARLHFLRGESTENTAAVMYGVKLLGDRMQSEGKQVGKSRDEIAQDGLVRFKEIVDAGLTADQAKVADDCFRQVIRNSDDATRADNMIKDSQ